MSAKILNAVHNAMLLIKAFWHQPQTIGAILPSSQRLTRLMAAQISVENLGFIIEIGAGTGAITAALLEHGIHATQLIVIEQSVALAKHLRKQFPEVTVIEGDAANLRQLLPVEVKQINAIVSSLPLRSLPDAQVDTILIELKNILAEHGKLIQYTYDIFSKNDRYMRGFQLVKSYSVWLNLPPAKVQVFENIS